MNTLRQAAKLALEALTLVESDKWAAIEALKTALAEPDHITKEELEELIKWKEEGELLLTTQGFSSMFQLGQWWADRPWRSV